MPYNLTTHSAPLILQVPPWGMQLFRDVAILTMLCSLLQVREVEVEATIQSLLYLEVEVWGTKKNAEERICFSPFTSIPIRTCSCQVPWEWSYLLLPHYLLFDLDSCSQHKKPKQPQEKTVMFPPGRTCSQQHSSLSPTPRWVFADASHFSHSTCIATKNLGAKITIPLCLYVDS